MRGHSLNLAEGFPVWKPESERRQWLGRIVLQRIEDSYLEDLEIECIMSAPPGHSPIVDGWIR
jgi:hypothetical protein